MKEKSAEKQKTLAKSEFTLTTFNDGPVVECLLNLILTKTNRHFRGLCEGLERASQGFIVKQCLSNQGKENKILFTELLIKMTSKLHLILLSQNSTLL